MLKGLEITELSNRSILVNNPTIRIDAEFFQKEFLEAPRFHVKLGTCAIIKSGTTPTDRDDNLDEGIILLKTANIQNSVLVTEDESSYYKISPTIATRMSETKLIAGDVLINIVGATTDVIGRVALVPDQFPEANITQAMALLRITDKSINSNFLFAFLAGSYGQVQVRRLARPTGQYNLNLAELATFEVPIVSSHFSNKIESCIQSVQLKISISKQLFQQAEQNLHHALRLDGWKPPEPLTYIRRASEVFAVGRFDAEYFYPSKKAALDLLAALPGKTVGELFTSVRDLWQPETALPTTLLRNYDLNDALSPFLDDTNLPSLPDSISSTKKCILKGDIVVSRLRSYLKEIAVVLDGGELPMVCSTEFIVLRPKLQSMRIETLLVYLRSTLPQLIFKWSQDGSNHPRFDEKELLNLRVPNIILEHDDVVANKVMAAIAARRESRELLERTKRAVEIAIEDNETTAIAYLNGD